MPMIMDAGGGGSLAATPAGLTMGRLSGRMTWKGGFPHKELRERTRRYHYVLSGLV